MNRKKINIGLIALLLLCTVSVTAQSRKERKALYNSNFNYEVQTLGVGVDGTKLIKVWGYAKKAKDAVYVAKRNAVAAAIFKGIPAAGGGMAAPTPPMCSDGDCWEKNEAFFTTFFEPGGKYLQFINLTNDGMPGGADRIKMKKGYKVAVTASVAFTNLRKYLEEQGIVRSLDSGF